MENEFEIKECGDFGELEKSITEEIAAIDKAAKYKTFFATFGSGKAFKDRYVGILASTGEDARMAMHDIFGDKWAFMYPGKDLQSSVLQYHYKPLIYVKMRRYGWSEEGSFEVVEIEASEYLLALEQEGTPCVITG